jgi:hypothetical protein
MKKCIDVSSYLRGACPPIRLLSAYLKQEDCQRVLTETLSESFILGAITGQDLSIKPMNVVMELAAKGVRNVDVKSEEVQKILRDRIGPLTKVCESFLKRILKCRMTRGMRRICGMLYEVADKKCPGDRKVADGLVGGFVFLRFFNPYILRIAQGRTKRVRDSLIIITKLLQNISNMVLFQKEKYMVPLNPFLEAKFPEVHKFFHHICTTKPQRTSCEADDASNSCSVFMSTRDMGQLYNIVLKRYASSSPLIEGRIASYNV